MNEIIDVFDRIQCGKCKIFNELDSLNIQTIDCCLFHMM